ncbi:ferredoxin [Lactovum miscens]|uniref:Ferredoxin n=1 Tax=Lactovum miscens TaxID=190387 RepID=A0A841C482_9LACT|nr:ferredoxin [Lactovum miscens]MBB5888736.1 ferredoxin [Lactovum miscens]
MKITLIPEKCIACGLCHQYASNIFDYDDAGIVKFFAENELIKQFGDFSDNASIEEQEKLVQAVKHCPTGAIIAELVW